MKLPKRRELTVAEYSQIVLLHSQGMSQQNCINNEAFATCDTINLKRFRGKTTARQDRYLERLALRNRFQTPKQLAADLSVEQDVSLCDRTVRRRLAEVNLKRRKARRKLYLSQQQMKHRLLSRIGRRSYGLTNQT
ncbi:hypothetical protein Trydic_g23330 [Trypoxylus dichotomus]